MKFRHLLYALLTLLIVSCRTVNQPTVNPESLKPSYRDVLARLDWGTDTIFVYGHKTPDVDAVTSALSYASLMRALGYNCKAKVSTPTNRETAYISNRFGFALPEQKSSVAAGTRLILTDHSDYAQCVDGAKEARILQKIDHHIEGDIADATIVSDTRNLTKTTTKGVDSTAWKTLVSQLRLEDQIAEINRGMEEAAYNYGGMTDAEILLSDYKDYEIGGHLIGFGSLVCKKTEMDAFINRMLAVMPEVMKQKGRDMIFAKIDNLIPNTDKSESASPYMEESTYFIYYGEGTKALAESIFGTSLREGVTYTKENLSRKQIVPLITEKLK